jgi:hypothetical protein
MKVRTFEQCNGVSFFRSRARVLINALHRMIRVAGLENDGLVSVESSKWGEYLETLDMDHAAMINWSYQYARCAQLAVFSAGARTDTRPSF